MPQKIYSKARETYSTISSTISIIDLDKSKTFIVGHTIPFGAIYVNPKYGKDVDKIVKEVEEVLSKTGKKLGVKIIIYRVKEIYSGVMLDKLPELIFSIDNWSGVVIKDFFKKFYI